MFIEYLKSMLNQPLLAPLAMPLKAIGRSVREQARIFAQGDEDWESFNMQALARKPLKETLLRRWRKEIYEPTALLGGFLMMVATPLLASLAVPVGLPLAVVLLAAGAVAGGAAAPWVMLGGRGALGLFRGLRQTPEATSQGFAAAKEHCKTTPLKDRFKPVAPPPPPGEAELALKEWGVAYERKPDGSIFVPGDLVICHKWLNALPDLSRVVVAGNFNCSFNRLSSLKGCPQSVGGSFYCISNELIDLEYAPPVIHGNFACGGNTLATLRGGPQSVGGIFDCTGNRTFLINMTTLEHAPQTFKEINSDFGRFFSWEEVPEKLRMSSDAWRQLERGRQAAAEEAARDPEVLKRSMAVGRPIRLKTPSLPQGF